MGVKANFGGDLRRLSFSSPPTFETLTSNLHACFPSLASSKFAVSYTDDEDDEITVASDADLAESFSVAKQDGRPSLHFKITLVVDSQGHGVSDASKELQPNHSAASFLGFATGDLSASCLDDLNKGLDAALAAEEASARATAELLADEEQETAKSVEVKAKKKA